MEDYIDPDVTDSIDTEEYAEIRIPAKLAEQIMNAPSGEKILSTCIDIAAFLALKNRSYGNSAIKPKRIFSKASATEQISVRIDDKLSRLIDGEEYPGDNDYLDLLGYLVLYFVAKAEEGN